MIGVDLHMHSNFSDGELSPVELIELAREKQLLTLALTDHDTIDGNVLAAQHAALHGIQFIQGVEISSFWHRPSIKKTHAVHIVALNMQNLEPMQQLLLKQKQHRAKRALLICEKLQQILKTDFLPEIRELVDGHDERITRSHIAKVLLKRNVVTRAQQAFDRFLKEGKAAYVPFLGVEMADAIDIIHQSQGFAVLAHPTKYDLSATNIRYMIEQFATAGGDAIELPPANTPLSTRQMLDRMVEQHQLKVSIGSDFHGAHMPWLSLGHVPKLKDGQLGIWEFFKL
ncbi:PHP domain-containing protein [Acinetobacter puyangensis]|uniref:PHP domain-containing protein n=1 Tax=Acinetobacter puyangensis TaxID=1096779 RepID=UPI003A4D397F